MKKTAFLVAATLVVVALVGAGGARADTLLALETCTLHPKAPQGVVLGMQPRMMDTYAIDAGLSRGTRLRDVVAVYRQGTRIAEGVVVYVGPGYSLITLRQSRPTLSAGDQVMTVGHSAVARGVEWKPSPEVVVVRERDIRASGATSGGVTFSGPTTFSGSTSFSGQGLFSGPTSFSGQTTSSSATSFSGSSSFGGGTSFNGGTSFSGGSSFSGSTGFNGQTSMTVPSF